MNVRRTPLLLSCVEQWNYLTTFKKCLSHQIKQNANYGIILTL